MMAAQLQIFMTNPASHTDCKGMWNLCVNLAVVVVVVKKKQFIPWSVDIAAADICLFRQRITWQQHSP